MPERLFILQQGRGANTAEGFRCHLEITGDIDQRSPENKLWATLHQFGITVLGRLKAEHIGMNLREDERLLQYLTIEHLNVHVLHCLLL